MRTRCLMLCLTLFACSLAVVGQEQDQQSQQSQQFDPSSIQVQGQAVVWQPDPWVPQITDFFWLGVQMKLASQIDLAFDQKDLIRYSVYVLDDGTVRVFKDEALVVIPSVQASTVYYLDQAILVVDDNFTPKVYSVLPGLGQYDQVLSKFLANLRDKRNSRWSYQINQKLDDYARWIKIYQDFDQVQFEDTKLLTRQRVIAQVQAPKGLQEEITLGQNLKFYANEGYTAALIVLYGNDNLADVDKAIQAINSQNMDIWFTYGGDEDNSAIVFINPDKLKRMIEHCAQVSRAFVLGWRRTSAHLFKQDRAFSNFLIKTAKDANSDLAIVGEGYFGKTQQDQVKNHVSYNMVDGILNCAIVGVGGIGISPRLVKETKFKEVKDLSLIGVVTGLANWSNPANPNRSKVSQLKVFQIKTALQKKFTENGFIGTITLHGDGTGRMYSGVKSIDNLSQHKLNFQIEQDK